MSFFSGQVALLASVDPRRGSLDVVPIGGLLGGTGHIAYVHPVTLFVGLPGRYREIAMRVAFSDPDLQPVYNVLGRRGFLDRVTLGLRQGGIPRELYLGFTP